MYLVKMGGGWGLVGTIEGGERSEYEVHIAEYLWQIPMDRGRIAFCWQKDMHLCPCMKVLHSMYLHVIEYS